MRVKVYLCKHCGRIEIVKGQNNLCPKCFYYMSEQEWDINDLKNSTIEKKGEEDGRR